MKKLFIGSDVILDIILERNPHVSDSKKLFASIEKNFFTGYTSALIISNVYYIISSNINKKVAIATINKLRSMLKILPYTDKEIGESANSNFDDFEDGIQYFIALNNGVNTLITRNIKDYKNADCNVFTPGDFLKLNEIKNIIENLQ